MVGEIVKENEQYRLKTSDRSKEEQEFIRLISKQNDNNDANLNDQNSVGIFNYKKGTQPVINNRISDENRERNDRIRSALNKIPKYSDDYLKQFNYADGSPYKHALSEMHIYEEMLKSEANGYVNKLESAAQYLERKKIEREAERERGIKYADYNDQLIAAKYALKAKKNARERERQKRYSQMIHDENLDDIKRRDDIEEERIYKLEQLKMLEDLEQYLPDDDKRKTSKKKFEFRNNKLIEPKFRDLELEELSNDSFITKSDNEITKFDNESELERKDLEQYMVLSKDFKKILIPDTYEFKIFETRDLCDIDSSKQNSKESKSIWSLNISDVNNSRLVSRAQLESFNPAQLIQHSIRINEYKIRKTALKELKEKEENRVQINKKNIREDRYKRLKSKIQTLVRLGSVLWKRPLLDIDQDTFNHWLNKNRSSDKKIKDVHNLFIKERNNLIEVLEGTKFLVNTKLKSSLIEKYTDLLYLIEGYIHHINNMNN